MSLIEVKDAIKTYQTGEDCFNALNCVSLSVDSGEFVAIMGASGSGKSTFMNMLGTLDKPNSGSYFLDGIDMLSLDTDNLAKVRNEKMGFVFQGFNLISRTTALENVELPMVYKGISEEERVIKAKEALKIVGLENREDHMPNQMSGGEQQRVGIARAIVNGPPLLIADEPTGNLDPKNSMEIMQILDQINQRGITVIVSTHDNAMVDYFRKRVITLDKGEIVRDIQAGTYE